MSTWATKGTLTVDRIQSYTSTSYKNGPTGPAGEQMVREDVSASSTPFFRFSDRSGFCWTFSALNDTFADTIRTAEPALIAEKPWSRTVGSCPLSWLSCKTIWIATYEYELRKGGRVVANRGQAFEYFCGRNYFSWKSHLGVSLARALCRRQAKMKRAL